MVTRTVPTIFPMIHPSEVMTGRMIGASLHRRLCQAQNYLWAQLRNVWSAFANEGNGNLSTQFLFDPAQLVVPGWEQLPDGRWGLRVGCFYVPKNWCSGSLLRVSCYMSGNDPKGDGGVVAQLFDLTEQPVGLSYYAPASDSPKRKNIDIPVPQTYGQLQCVLYLVNNYPVNDTPLNKYFRLISYSARYVNAAADGFGITPEGWSNRYNPNIPNATSAASVFYWKLVNNTLWHWFANNPEICHYSFHRPWNNATKYAETARYYINVPANCTARYHLVHRALGNTGGWRIRDAGLIVASGVITAGGSTSTSGTISLTAGEHLITLEGACASNVSNFGYILQGFQLCEETRPMVGTGNAAPASYAPLDEAQFVGDRLLPHRDTFAQFMANDRWLFVNRRRMFINCWNHRVAKAFGYDTISGWPDMRTQYTRHPRETDLTLSVTGEHYRNITLRSEYANETAIPQHNYNLNGITPDDPSLGGAGTGYLTAPFYWPNSGSWQTHGSTLSLGALGVVSNTLAGLRRKKIAARARRKVPDALELDNNDMGRYTPLARNPDYRGRAYLKVYTPANVLQKQITAVDDTQPSWQMVGTLAAETIASDLAIRVVGRCPAILDQYGAPDRPEGMLYEVEMMSMSIVDEPYNQQELNAL